jgi:curli production assembly/transport component CsgG
MRRYMGAAILVLLSALLGEARAQIGLFSKRETFSVPVAHPPELVLPNVKRIAITGFAGLGCGQELKDHLSEAITRSGTFELIDRTTLGSLRSEQDLQASAFADRTNAVRLGKLLGPTAIMAGTVSRCNAEYSPIATQQQYKDKKGRVHTTYTRSTTAHLGLSVQIIDVATSKVVLYRTFAYNPVEERQAEDSYPAAVDGREVMEEAITAAGQDVEHLLFGWRESISVTVHADKECDLKPAALQIRGGDFTGAAETMQKAIDRQCGAPDDKIALAKAYHNRGVALTYAGRPEDGLRSLQQANSLWPGNVSEEAMTAAQKIIQARGQQQTQDEIAAEAARATAPATGAVVQVADASLLSNRDVTEMVQARLSDQIVISKVRTTKCRFDTSPSALIQLKKSGASDAVVLAVTEAQCAK